MLPIYQTAGSAAADLTADLPDLEDEQGNLWPDSTVILPGERALISTGVDWQDITFGDKNVCGLVLPRSGLASKHGVTVLNAPGLIDPDYAGTIGVLLINHGTESFWVRNGDRIAQLLIMPMYRHWNLEISAAVRGSGGFGSTGV